MADYTPVIPAWKSGVQGDLSPFDVPDGWADADKMRFNLNTGLAQVIAGYTASVDDQVVGVPRPRTHAWATINGTRVYAVGTHSRLYLLYGGALYNITPLRDSGTLGADPFTTTDESAVVAVAHVGHNLTAGDTVIYDGATAVGGITIDGEYTVTSVTSSSAYTITHSSAATSSASGGGSSVDYEYEINIGKVNATPGYGWGAGGFGEGTYGTPRNDSDIIIQLRTWCLDNWGEDLLAQPRGGGLYHWDATAGPTARATLVSAAPTGTYMVVDGESRHVLVFGADGDPSAIRNCNQGDFADWTASITSTADTRRLLSGSGIVTVVPTTAEFLVLTDTSCHALRYVGDAEFAYALDLEGKEGGCIGRHAAIAYNGIAYWMGRDQFYRYTGRVEPVPCSVLDKVFKNLDSDYVDKISAGTFGGNAEVWWFYPSTAGDGENDRYVHLNTVRGAWTPGTFDRNAWVDAGVFANPMAVDASGQIYDHETGTGADGAALEWFIESGYSAIDEGGQVMRIGGFFPDIRNLQGGAMAGSVNVTLKAAKYPQEGAVTTKGPYAVTSATKYRKGRARGRFLAVRFSSDTAGTQVRIGRQRFLAKPDGRQ